MKTFFSRPGDFLNLSAFSVVVVIVVVVIVVVVFPIFVVVVVDVFVVVVAMSHDEDGNDDKDDDNDDNNFISTSCPGLISEQIFYYRIPDIYRTLSHFKKLSINLSVCYC